MIDNYDFNSCQSQTGENEYLNVDEIEEYIATRLTLKALNLRMTFIRQCPKSHAIWDASLGATTNHAKGSDKNDKQIAGL